MAQDFNFAGIPVFRSNDSHRKRRGHRENIEKFLVSLHYLCGSAPPWLFSDPSHEEEDSYNKRKRE
jgi:hypothetical protein